MWERTRDQIDKARWIAVLAAIALGLYLCWLMLRPFATVLEWAVVLVIIFFPLHKRIFAKVKRPGLSALLSSMLVIVVFITPLTLLTVALANELGTAAHRLPEYFTKHVDSATPFGKLSEWIHERFALDPATSQAWVVEQLKNAASAVVGKSLGFVGNIVSGIVKAFFVLFTMYYLFRDGDKIVRALPRALPFSEEQTETIIRRTSEVVHASVYGVIAIAILQGALATLAFWVLGVPSALLWGVVLTLVCMIPIAASFIVWLPAAIYLLMNGHWINGVLLILWGALVVSTIDNFLRPKLIKTGTRLHELLIFFAVMGGISLFGLLGIVLGPIVLAITLALLQPFTSYASHSEPADSVPSQSGQFPPVTYEASNRSINSLAGGSR